VPTTREIEKYLKTYSLYEIFEYNDVTEEDVLTYLVNEDYLELPEHGPVDMFDD
jgi:hypothetical protein